MAVRPIDANAMLNELRPVSFESEHSAMLLSDVSKMMREWVERQPTLTPQNEPLTIEQLREMDGEPVWLDVADGVWALVDTDDDCVWLDRGGSIDIYKLTGKVYRRPPERQEDT